MRCPKEVLPNDVCKQLILHALCRTELLSEKAYFAGHYPNREKLHASRTYSISALGGWPTVSLRFLRVITSAYFVRAKRSRAQNVSKSPKKPTDRLQWATMPSRSVNPSSHRRRVHCLTTRPPCPDMPAESAGCATAPGRCRRARLPPSAGHSRGGQSTAPY